jgi:hypothetical protein
MEVKKTLLGRIRRGLERPKPKADPVTPAAGPRTREVARQIVVDLDDLRWSVEWTVVPGPEDLQ